MSLLRVRRHGNSLVVTLTQEILEQARLGDGDLVRQSVDDRGRVVLEAVSIEPRVSPRMEKAIKVAAKKERAVLKRLAEHDRR